MLAAKSVVFARNLVRSRTPFRQAHDHPVLLSPWDAFSVGGQPMHDIADTLAGIDHDRLDVAVLFLHRDIDQQVALDRVLVFDPKF